MPKKGWRKHANGRWFPPAEKKMQSETQRPEAPPQPAKMERFRKSLKYKDVLTAEERPGYVRRIVNDDPMKPGRIQELEEAGWSVVRGKKKLGDDSADNVGGLGSVISRPMGGGIVGVLMEKPEEFYEEDMKRDYYAEADRKEDEIMAAVKRPGRYGSVTIGNKHVSQAPR